MKTEPNLSRERLIYALVEHYRLIITAFEFLPLGEDGACYIVHSANGQKYIAKLIDYRRKQPLYDVLSRQEVTWKLRHDADLEFVVAPLKTTRNELVINLDGYPLALFPYVEGRRYSDGEVSGSQLRHLARCLARLHLASVPTDLLPPSVIEIPYAAQVERELRRMEEHALSGDPYIRLMGKLLLGRRHRILAIIETLRDLHQHMMLDERSMVIVHTDPTPQNILFGVHDDPHLIDWDGVRFGWPEADLIHFADKDAFPTVLDEYAQVVPFSLRGEALAYYMYDRLIADVWDRIPSVLDTSLPEFQRRHELEMLEEESSGHDEVRAGVAQVAMLLRNVQG